MPIPRTSQNLCAKSTPFPITGIFIKRIPFLIYFYTANTYSYSTILYNNRQCTYYFTIIYLLFLFCFFSQHFHAFKAALQIVLDCFLPAHPADKYKLRHHPYLPGYCLHIPASLTGNLSIINQLTIAEPLLLKNSIAKDRILFFPDVMYFTCPLTV